MPTSNESLFAAVRTWVAENYPCTYSAEIVVVLSDGRKARLPVPVAVVRAPDPEPDRCEADVLAVLTEVGHRLTTTHLLSEFAARGIVHSDRAVAGKLALLVQQGVLTNPKRNGRYAGYGLPGWE